MIECRVIASDIPAGRATRINPLNSPWGEDSGRSSDLARPVITPLKNPIAPGPCEATQRSNEYLQTAYVPNLTTPADEPHVNVERERRNRGTESCDSQACHAFLVGVTAVTNSRDGGHILIVGWLLTMIWAF